MFFKTITLVLSLASAVTPYPSAKRDGDMNIFAYGDGISGLTVFGGADGKAYLTSATTSNTTLNELIWQTPSADAPWNVTMIEKTNNSTSPPASFYIVTTSGAFEDCGFKNANLTAPEGANMMGFMKFGTQIIWSDSSDGSYISQFWAESTETDGLYKLKWNVAGVKKADSVSVTLKTIAPA